MTVSPLARRRWVICCWAMIRRPEGGLRASKMRRVYQTARARTAFGRRCAAETVLPSLLLGKRPGCDRQNRRSSQMAVWPDSRSHSPGTRNNSFGHRDATRGLRQQVALVVIAVSCGSSGTLSHDQGPPSPRRLKGRPEVAIDSLVKRTHHGFSDSPGDEFSHSVPRCS